MGQSCTFIPKEKGSNSPSKLFKDLQAITNNRKLTIALWTSAQDSSFLKSIDMTVGSNEPTAIDFLNHIKGIKDLLSEESYAKYITLKENLDTEEFENFREAQINGFELNSKYDDSLLFVTSQTENGFKLTAMPKDSKSKRIYAKQRALSDLNSELIDYMGNLGLAVAEIDNLETAGKFNPLNADKNAEGLLEVIQIIKGEIGQKALPEEFAHLIVEGLKQNPLMQRLIKLLTNNDFAKEVLGENYNSYAEQYKGNEYKLASEAAAKLIANNILDRAGISDNLALISNRVLDKIQGIFEQGDSQYIKDLISELNSTINNIVDSLKDNDTIEAINLGDMMSSGARYQLSNEIGELEKLANQAYEVMSKRMKLTSLRNKEGKLSKGDMQAFNEMTKQLEKKRYAASCFTFLNNTIKDVNIALNSLEKRRKEFNSSDKFSDQDLKKLFVQLRNVDTTINAYADVLSRLEAIKSDPDLAGSLTQEDMDTIVSKASEINRIFSSLENISKDLRLRSLMKFYEKYWGKDKMITVGKEKKLITLKDVLESTIGDTNLVSRMINSISDMPDLLCQLVGIAYKDTEHNRDVKIFEMQQKLAVLQENLYKETGSRSTKFMYVYDENGNPTGMIKSNIDYAKYYKEKHEYRKSLEAAGTSKEDIIGLLKKWESNHTEIVKISANRHERMPKKALYPSNDVDLLTKAQRDYYDSVMAIKKQMEELLPSSRTHLYRAVQKKVSSKDAILQDKSLKSLFKSAKDSFVSSVDDSEFGETEMVDGKYIVTDFAGKPLKKVPIYYTTWLGADMKYLDTNFTDSLLSYAAMAYNYEAMNNLVDALEVTSLQMKSRDVYQTAGEKSFFSRFTIMGKVFDSKYKKKGEDSELQKKLDSFIERVPYGRHKNIEELTIGNKTFNVGKTGDNLKSYTTLVGMGYNALGGGANLSIGIVQNLLTATGGEFFTVKDLLWAHKEYFKEIGGYIKEIYEDKKNNKLSLLDAFFDPDDDFSHDVHSSSYNSGLFKKVIGKHNPLIFNTVGEHYLHNSAMIAILRNIKVKQEGMKEISLYEALTPVGVKAANGEVVYNKIGIPDGYKTLDGEIVDMKYLASLKLKIHGVLNSVHGAFSEADKGEIHKYVLGRLGMQYRQWMPAYYMKLFKSRRYNLITDQEEEGAFITMFKFIAGTMKDALQLKFNIATRFNMLSTHEKANLRYSGLHTLALIALQILLGFWDDDDDEKRTKDPGYEVALKLWGYRLETDLGASNPFNLIGFYDNAMTLFKTPVPAMEGTDRLVKLLDFTLLGETIQSGKYEGWNRWVKNLYYAVPYVKNIGRIIELAEGDESILQPFR